MKLADYCLRITDGEHCTVKDDAQGGYFLLSNKNIVDSRIVIGSNERRINKMTFDKINKRIQLESDDILISTVGTLGKTAIVYGNPNYVFQRSVGIIKPDKKKVVSEYLKYLLDTPSYQKKLVYSAQGAIQKCIFIGDLTRLEIDLPDLPTQKRIASVLSNIDRKIALNRAMNEELEQTARDLYDYWFLQFDFPDANGKPYRSSGGKMVYNPQLKREIPKGWEVKSLGELIGKLSSGKRPGAIDKSLKNGIPSLGAECIDELGVFNYASTPFVAEEFRPQMTSGLIEDRDILIYKDGAYVGKTTMFQDDFPYQEAFVNEHVFLLHCLNEDLQEYLLFTLKLPTYFEIMQSLGKAKAAQPGLNQTDLKSVLVAIPNDDLLTKFRHHIADQMHSIFNNSLEAENLRKLRDELLPLLMNGQVTIAD